MFENLKMYYPWIANDILEAEEYDDFELIVTTRSGARYLYDDMLKTIEPIRENEDENVWKRRFGMKIRTMMRRRGLTQKDLSDKAGVSTTTLSMYMTGRSAPNIYMTEKIARALGCSVEELLHFPK